LLARRPDQTGSVDRAGTFLAHLRGDDADHTVGWRTQDRLSTFPSSANRDRGRRGTAIARSESPATARPGLRPGCRHIGTRQAGRFGPVSSPAGTQTWRASVLVLGSWAPHIVRRALALRLQLQRVDLFTTPA
jgi:hypothetical protein